MYELKTKLNDASVNAFLETIEESDKKSDYYKIVELIRSATGTEPKM